MKLCCYLLLECNATSFDGKLEYCLTGRHDEISENKTCIGQKKTVVDIEQSGKCGTTSNVHRFYHTITKTGI